MVSEFEVAAKDTEVLGDSHLVAEMQSQESEHFPVLIGDYVAYFHSVDGGYHREDGYHVVNFTHEVQGRGRPPEEWFAPFIEAHIDDTYFYMEVEDVWPLSIDYPDEDFTVSIKVTGYQTGPYSFSEELKAEVDKREQEHEW